MNERRGVGVRFSRSPRVRFFACDSEPVMSGDWVIVSCGDGECAGQVVIAPGPVAMTPDMRMLGAVVRVVDPHEYVAACDPADEEQPTAGSARLIGGTGFCDVARHNVSAEDSRFQAMKRRFPVLGATIESPRDSAMVIAADVFKELVTIRYDENGETETVPLAEILTPNQED